MEGKNFDCISCQDLLELPFLEEEVQKTIFNMKGNKTLGLMVLRSHFFKIAKRL